MNDSPLFYKKLLAKPSEQVSGGFVLLKKRQCKSMRACNYAYFEKFCGYVLHYSADCAKIKK